MKAKISILIGAVALVTLSFTFAGIHSPSEQVDQKHIAPSTSAPIGGFVADTMTK